jgi:3-oxoacyl-[acyl-carrier-protein] synthase II
MQRVVVTGMAGISPLGNDWPAILGNLRAGRTGIRQMPDWVNYEGLDTQLGAPAMFHPPAHFNRKKTRSMGRVAQMATHVAEQALEQAGLLGEPVLTSGRAGVAYGSSAGSTAAVADFGGMLIHRSTLGLNANSYLKMMSHTTAVNIGVYFGLQGRVHTTSSACTSGSQGIGYAWEAIRFGLQDVMVAGGAEELCPTQAAVFDTLFAASQDNDHPSRSPRPFDRGAPILAEIVGYGTNSDGRHVTQPNQSTMATAMRLALDSAGLEAERIGYVSAHGTATARGDVAETQATREVLGGGVPISSLKSYTGHTLGACGALEAWLSIEMMRQGWFHPNANLENVDPECGALDYITGAGRELDCEYAMSNNFAFGGINTSLIFRRWPG